MDAHKNFRNQRKICDKIMDNLKLLSKLSKRDENLDVTPEGVVTNLIPIKQADKTL